MVLTRNNTRNPDSYLIATIAATLAMQNARSKGTSIKRATTLLCMMDTVLENPIFVLSDSQHARAEHALQYVCDIVRDTSSLATVLVAKYDSDTERFQREYLS